MDIARVHTLVDNTHNTATGVDVERAVLTKGLADCHRLTHLPARGPKSERPCRRRWGDAGAW